MRLICDNGGWTGDIWRFTTPIGGANRRILSGSAGRLLRLLGARAPRARRNSSRSWRSQPGPTAPDRGLGRRDIANGYRHSIAIDSPLDAVSGFSVDRAALITPHDIASLPRVTRLASRLPSHRADDCAAPRRLRPVLESGDHPSCCRDRGGGLRGHAIDAVHAPCRARTPEGGRLGACPPCGVVQQPGNAIVRTAGGSCSPDAGAGRRTVEPEGAVHPRALSHAQDPRDQAREVLADPGRGAARVAGDRARREPARPRGTATP